MARIDARNSNPRWRRRFRLALLGGVLLAGLAVSATGRFQADAALRLWNPGHRLLATLLIDPFRARSANAIRAGKRAGDLWSVDQENQELRQELARFAASNQVLLEQLGHIERLTGLGEWGATAGIVFMPANVIGVNGYDGALLQVDKGERDGLRPRDPAVSLAGLVGIVRSTTPRGAVIQTIADPLSAIGAIAVSAGGIRSRGVVHGGGLGQPLEFVPENEVEPIQPGAVLISSGFNNSIYPKGLVIGEISKRDLDPYGLPYGVVAPAVQVESVEEVLIVMPESRAGQGAIRPALTLESAPTTGTLAQALRVRMPAAAARLWEGKSTETMNLILGIESDLPTSATQRTSGTLTTSGSLPAALLPRLPALPKATDEPPVPTIDMWLKKQSMEGGALPGGGAPANDPNAGGARP